MLRFSAFRRMAKYYFADKAEQCEDLFDYGKCHLGEDRWLTHLFMIGAKKRYQIQMCTTAFCKTEAVQTYKSLIKQRRRWFLGFITNEVCMLTDMRIWRRYPILSTVRFMQNTIRTTALLFFIMVLSLITTSKTINDLPVGFIAISLGLNWLMMIYFGWKLKRFKIWLYPVMFIVNPFFNWFYMVYGIFTAGQRTWGGPRADAGSADAHTTPQQAIEKAEGTGDDLNVVPETFKPAAEAQNNQLGRPAVPLLPPDRLEGRFAAAERLPGGWYQQANDSLVSVGGAGLLTNRQGPRIPLHPRDSFDSYVSAQSNGNSVYVPRRVESIMGEEDRKKYAMAQANQRAAGGAYMTAPAQGHVYEISESDFSKDQWNESMSSLGSYHDRPSHQRATSYNSITGGDGSPEGSPSASGGLSIPQPSVAGGRNVRASRSPLARSSLIRTLSGEESPIELEETRPNQSRQSPTPTLRSDGPKAQARQPTRKP